MDNKKDYIKSLYDEARSRGLCFTQKEFAALLGINQSTLSSVLKGDEKYLTDNLIRRIKAWERQVLQREPAAQAQAQPARPDIVIPAATMDLYTSMAKSIDRLTALVERLQPGASAFTSLGNQAPKNYRIEDL